MFGKRDIPVPPQTPVRPAAAERAQILGGGLVQIIVTSLMPFTYYIFLNQLALPQEDIESFSLSIEAPGNDNGQQIVRATLARYVRNVAGERILQHYELFPCTIELVALGRRLQITCSHPDSLDGLWISLGLKEDGSTAEVSGARALRLLITEGILDAKLTWEDGEVEDLLPQ